MIIERDKLLGELRAVIAGLNDEETTQQSNCFVFNKGLVMTYNDEAACRLKSSLHITAAINASKMLGLLEKWPEKEIEFKRSKGKLQFKGKNKRGHLKTEDNITLPIKDVEAPSSWVALPSKFWNAVTGVSGCASDSSESPHLCCIHITQKWVEACDGTQAARMVMKTPFTKPVLLQKDAMQRIINLEMTKFSETKNWVHFRNKKGLTASCHKNFEDYPTDTLSEVFKAKGTPTTLPKDLKRMVDRLKVFIDEGKGSQWLSVSLSPNTAKISATGKYGSQTERKKVSYNGKAAGFYINPQLLYQLSDKNDECEITKQTIKIKKDKFMYVTSLWVPTTEQDEE